MRKEVCQACRNNCGVYPWTPKDDERWERAEDNLVCCPPQEQGRGQVYLLSDGDELRWKQEPPTWCLCKMEHLVLSQ